MKDEIKLISLFQETIQKSQEDCGKRLNEMSNVYEMLPLSFIHIIENNSESTKYLDSLLYWCYMESYRIISHTIYLSYCGLYRNAFDNIRHFLESIMQATYIDINHPKEKIETKLAILKEIEKAREYHTKNLFENKIDFKKLKCEGVDCKGLINKEYRKLSKIVHPSSEKVFITIDDVAESKGIPVTIDCEEISRIFNSLIITYNIFYFLLIAHFPEIIKPLNNNAELKKFIKKHHLYLIDKILKK